MYIHTLKTTIEKWVIPQFKRDEFGGDESQI